MPNIKARIKNKHDTEANWASAVNFTPLAGEVIVYDVDANHAYPRFKVGDGKTLVSALPFSTDVLTNYVTETELASALSETTSAINKNIATIDDEVATHVAAINNPHQVTKEQVNLGNVDNVKQYSASNPPPYPVTSVNGETGAVSITSVENANSATKATQDGNGNVIVTSYGASLDLTMDSKTFVLTVTLKNKNGQAIGSQSVDLPLETMVVNARFDEETNKIILTLQNGTEISFSVASLVDGLATSEQLNAEISARQSADSTLENEISTISSTSNSHIANKSNPHKVTVAQIGAEPSFAKNTAFNKNFGKEEGTVCEGNDERLNKSSIYVAIESTSRTATTANISGISQGTVFKNGDILIVDIKKGGRLYSLKINGITYSIKCSKKGSSDSDEFATLPNCKVTFIYTSNESSNYFFVINESLAGQYTQNSRNIITDIAANNTYMSLKGYINMFYMGCGVFRIDCQCAAETVDQTPNSNYLYGFSLTKILNSALGISASYVGGHPTFQSAMYQNWAAYGLDDAFVSGNGYRKCFEFDSANNIRFARAYTSTGTIGAWQTRVFKPEYTIDFTLFVSW